MLLTRLFSGPLGRGRHRRPPCQCAPNPKQSKARKHYSNVIYMNGAEQPRSILVHMARHIQAASCAKRIYCGGNAHEKTKTVFCRCGSFWWPHSDRCIRDANRTNPSRHGCTGRASALGLRPLSVLVATKLLRGLRRLWVLPTPPLSPLLASPLLVMFRGGANLRLFLFERLLISVAHSRGEIFKLRRL